MSNILVGHSSHNGSSSNTAFALVPDEQHSQQRNPSVIVLTVTGPDSVANWHCQIASGLMKALNNEHDISAITTQLAATPRKLYIRFDPFTTEAQEQRLIAYIVGPLIAKYRPGMQYSFERIAIRPPLAEYLQVYDPYEHYYPVVNGNRMRR